MVRVQVLGRNLFLLIAASVGIASAYGQALIPINTEALEARSWIARRELDTGDLNTALKHAQEIQQLCQQAAAGRRIDEDPHLATALGAAFEVQAQSLDKLHQKTEAVQLLQNAIAKWAGTSIEARLQKNLNLLTLTGKPLPVIRSTEWIGSHAPPNKAALPGKVVLVFFWAHWCPDCKAEAPVLERLAAKLEPRGLVVIAPTARYGYTPRNENAPPAEEKAFIEQVFSRFYSAIPQVSVPLDNSNFERFGASTTPTLVLTDRRGIVRLYHPGYMDEAALESAIDHLLTPAPQTGRTVHSASR